jgi:hypothetical protein
MWKKKSACTVTQHFLRVFSKEIMAYTCKDVLIRMLVTALLTIMKKKNKQEITYLGLNKS